MNQLNSVYNVPFLVSYSHPIHTCLSMIASNESVCVGAIVICNGYGNGTCKQAFNIGSTAHTHREAMDKLEKDMLEMKMQMNHLKKSTTEMEELKEQMEKRLDDTSSEASNDLDEVRIHLIIIMYIS